MPNDIDELAMRLEKHLLMVRLTLSGASTFDKFCHFPKN